MIPKARLDAIPWARFTVAFKEMLEKGLVSFDDNYDESDDENEDDEDIENEDDEDIEPHEDEDELDKAMEHLDKHMAMMGDDEGDDDED